MKRYLSIIAQIWPWYIKEIFVRRFKMPDPIKLPKFYDKYELVKSLSEKGFPFATGLYKNKNGQEVVIKFWRGATKNIYYFNLLHQIEMMQVLTAAQKRLTLLEKRGFSIPRYIGSFIEKSEIVLIMEKVNGKSLEAVKNANDQFTVYKECLMFLKNLSKTLTAKERKIITTKSVWDFLFLYPFILLTAILIQPELLWTLVRGIPAFLRGIPALMKIKPNVLVHGDMHPDNVLVLGDKYYLVDVENMRLCYGLYEPASTISLKGNSDMFKQLVANYYLLPAVHNIAVSLIVNNATHNLSGDKDVEGIASYKQAFNLAFAI